MDDQNDNNRLEKRQKLALEVLRVLLQFAESEKWEVPNEFLTAAEGLAAIVKEPDFFLFHDENGRY
jgi:hypothetical protein